MRHQIFVATALIPVWASGVGALLLAGSEVHALSK
jgi:hypothetical protein